MERTNETYMRYAVLISLFCNIVLVSIKAAALMVVNSLAIATDLGISVVGLTVSVILYYSIRLANRPADLLHNYGYGKVENVCEGMEGVVLMGVALAISSQAVLGFFHPQDIKFPWVGLASSGVNLMINFVGAYFIFKMAHRSGSPAVYAEGVHYRLEGFISTAIAASFAISMLLRANGLRSVAIYVDPAAALIVSLWVIIPSFKMARKAFFNLLDATVGEESQMEILKHLGGHLNEFCEFRGLRSRVAGRKKFVEFKLIVPEDIPFLAGYKTVERIQNEIQENIPDCEVQITMQPCAKDCEFVRNNEPCPYIPKQ